MEEKQILMLEERQKIYEEEKARIEAREKTGKEKKGMRSGPKDPVKIPPGVVVLVAIIGLVLFFVYSMRNISSLPPGTGASTSSGIVGTEAHLKLGDGQYPTPVAEDEQTYKEMMEAIRVKDIIGTNKFLLYSDKVFMAPTGTKVWVLESGLERAKVRILEGNNYGKSGWVPRQTVQ